MNTLNVYKKIDWWFNTLTKKYGITNSKEYLTLTDYSSLSLFRTSFGLKDLSDPTITEKEKKNYLFAQFCYHRHNATLINGVIKLVDYPNYGSSVDVLKNVFCEFDYDAFVAKYDGLSLADLGRKIYNDGLKWKLIRDKKVILPADYHFEKSMAAKYFLSMLNVAKLLQDPNLTREGFINKMKSLVPTQSASEIINVKSFLISKGILGFQEKLTADFLKELDPYFSNLCKPDTHIHSFIETIYGVSDLDDIECMVKFNDFLTDLQSKTSVTGYELDRKIYLICAGNFFLNGINFRNKYKDEFLADIKKAI